MPRNNSGHGVSNYGLLERIEDDPPPEDGEEKEEDGIPFYVNKSGFPINRHTWERMYDYAARVHPESYKMVHKIKSNKQLPNVQIPQAPVSFPTNTGIPERLNAIQRYMIELQYNHTGTQFFEIKKNRPISGLMDAAKEMIRESLPIKCLEAVILSLYLTLGIPGLDRFPISFKTRFNGRCHRHVVLGLYCLGKYGALGMSRRDDLMYKPLKYKNLSDLIKDYIISYENYWHEVLKVKIGLNVPHDAHSYDHIHWKQLSLTVPKTSSEDLAKSLDRFARELRAQTKKWETLASVYNPSQKTRPISTGGPPSPHMVRRSTSIGPCRPATDPKSLTQGTRQDRSLARSSQVIQFVTKSVAQLRLSSDSDEDTKVGPKRRVSNKDYQIRI